VTRKITRGVALILAGKEEKLRLGNLDAIRDWGYARDYVEAMRLMLRHPEPGDYVIATGTAYTVRQFVEATFRLVGLEWEKYVVQDQALMRPADVPELRGDPSRARKMLGWKPRENFVSIVAGMLDADLQEILGKPLSCFSKNPT
jgi:GDPmannose 4,6-dehydratase